VLAGLSVGERGDCAQRGQRRRLSRSRSRNACENHDCHANKSFRQLELSAPCCDFTAPAK